MTNGFKKLRLKQVQERLNEYMNISKTTVPKNGWIRTIRDALGISSYYLANVLNCSRANISFMEKSEKTGTITLNTLSEVAEALNCKLVYALVPLETLDNMISKQANKIAKRELKSLQHSMNLEQQGLTEKQLTQQEKDLVKKLIENPKKLWTLK